MIGAPPEFYRISFYLIELALSLADEDVIPSPESLTMAQEEAMARSWRLAMLVFM